jgi:predicted lipoprotein with Yx(FWY)xxD motif
MRLSRRFRPIALAIAALSIPVMALAQDMGPLSTRDNPTLGTIVTNTDGRTVYFWAGDTAGAGTSNCNDQCAGAWPPVPFDVDMMMAAAPDMTMDMMMDMTMSMTGVGAIQRNDGSYQVTWNGWPLYYFSRDAAPGDANGNGSTGFGNAWSVVPATM